MPLAIGIDLGGTNIKGGLITEKGEIKSQTSIPTLVHEGPDAVVERIVRIVNDLRSDQPGAIAGVGIGSPGPLNPVEGYIYTTPNMPGWENYRLKDRVAEKTNLPVTVENDANCAVLAENWLGSGKGSRTMILLTLGTGIGGGIIFDGKLVNGSVMSAGEVGHIVINHNGPKCGCGSHGCLEAYCGAAGIVSRAWELIEKPGTVSVLREKIMNDRTKLTPAIISAAAAEGDGVALSVLRETGKLLGIGITSLVNLFAPEKVILGGGVAAAGETLFHAIREHVRRYAFAPASQDVEIVPAAFKNDAGIIGAAGLYLIKTDTK